jgi:hypothetical protein
MARESRSNEEGPKLRREARPWEKPLDCLFAMSPALTCQFAGKAGRSIETGNGGRSPAAGGMAADGPPPGDGELGGPVAGGLVTCPAGDLTVPAPAGGAVVTVRPSEAATEVDPIPGTVGSIKLAGPPDRPRGVAPVVRLTSRPVLAAGPPEPGAGPACERVGSRCAGV